MIVCKDKKRRKQNKQNKQNGGMVASVLPGFALLSKRCRLPLVTETRLYVHAAKTYRQDPCRVEVG
jgi:hypothetical protein